MINQRHDEKYQRHSVIMNTIMIMGLSLHRRTSLNHQAKMKHGKEEHKIRSVALWEGGSAFALRLLT